MNAHLNLLKKLEDSFCSNNPRREKVLIKILGYGEMSVVFEILDNFNGYAYKRLAIFDEESQIERQIQAFKEYYRILTEKIGINTPPYEIIWFRDRFEKIKFYYIQQKLPSISIGNNAIHYLGENDIKNLVLLIMREMRKVWLFNQSNDRIKVGFDSQISNFAIENFNQNNSKIGTNSILIYLDTIPPFFRINGNEAMDINLLLKTVPTFLKWILKINYIQKIMKNVVNRYYDLRTTTIDLIANFSKEQKSDLIPALVKLVNNFFTQEASELNIEPIYLNEVIKYYKHDRLIWIIYQYLRRVDKFMITKLFRRRYEFFLPPKIKR
ncbi:MAG: DUF6206 family protein [Promethearchaeota archaeon]